METCGDAGADDASLGREALWARVQDAYLGHRVETKALLAHLLAEHPSFARGHALRGIGLFLSGRRAELPAMRAALAAARASDDRDARSLTDALEALCRDEPALAAALLERSVEHADAPVLRLKLAHALRFLIGAPSAMRASLARALPLLAGDTPGYGYALGLYAFALEETGDLAGALVSGHEALEREPRDVWGAHAVVHVHAMRGETALGATWLDAHAHLLHGTSNFGAHMGWHRALFHLAADEVEFALTVYDERVACVTEDFRDDVNAISLLVQAARMGHDVRARVADLVARLGRTPTDHGLAFADVHRALLLVHAGARSEASRLLARMRAYADGADGHQAQVFRDVGIPYVKALLEGVGGEDAAALHTSLVRLGGSHVQRATLHQALDPTATYPFLPGASGVDAS